MGREVKYLDYISKSRKIEKEDKKQFSKLGIAILRSFTLEIIEPILKVELFKEKIDCDLFFGEYNNYYQEIFDYESRFYKFNPDICVISIRLEELYKGLIINFLEEKDNLLEIEDYIISQYRNMIDKIRDKLKCNIFIHNFMIPYNNYTSLYDFQHTDGQANFIRKLNIKLVEIANEYTGVYIIDIEKVAGFLGKININDNKMWYIAKNPYKYEFYITLTKEYLKYIKAIYGIRKKCIILDLDNTLWGGIIGEDGIAEIKLGESYPGNCYKDFQSQLLKLKKRGVILAICSKNNVDDIEEVLKQHPDMVLKKDDFACIKANWKDKYINIKAISEELNIGLDSIVFIDDNPIECELIKQRLPEVEVINLPGNPLEYVDLISNLSYFETIKLTSEDLRKTEIYKLQIDRKKLKNTVNSLEEYYRSLEMEIEIKIIDDFALPRVAQLTQKTNQFNLTTKRYTEEDIKKIMQDKNNKIYYARVMDRFGDNGITGCCILKKISDNKVQIDTFLLSCRVIGRSIENAFMYFIYKKLKEDNIKQLIGEYIPTKKNVLVKDFYKNFKFNQIKSNKYIFDIEVEEIECPNYIKIIY